MSISTCMAIDDTTVALLWRDANGRAANWQSATLSHDGRPETIARTIDELAPRATSPGAGVRITLARPLAHTRTIALPRMTRTMAESVLARDWSRHVIGHRATPHTASARVADRDHWLAAFAPADHLDTLEHAAAKHGWPAPAIVTSDDALAAAARTLSPGHAGAGDSIVVLCGAAGPTDVVHLRAGLPWLGRRLPLRANEGDVATFTHAALQGDGARAALLLGHPTHTTVLAKALGALGIRTTAADLGVHVDASSLELLAVAGTFGVATLPLRSSHARQRARETVRSATRWIAVAAVALVLAGLGTARWQAGRDLSRVRRERAAISAAVGTAMTARSEVEGAMEAAATLAERESAASRVSGVLAAVALALPPGSTLTMLRVAGDSVSMEGESPRSALVYAAMRAVPVLEQVTLAAPLRQERQADAAVIEHFAFSARVKRGVSR